MLRKILVLVAFVLALFGPTACSNSNATDPSSPPKTNTTLSSTKAYKVVEEYNGKVWTDPGINQIPLRTSLPSELKPFVL